MNDSNFIDKKNIVQHTSYDPNGYIFSWNNRIYRAIYPNNQKKIICLWDSGLILDLIKLNLFPETRITNYKTSDSDLIFEHQKIDVITYPYEWSFSMLKDAALAVLRVNKIARKYGYQTLDAHGYNIAFFNARALFIDMGSFVEINTDFNCKHEGWRSYGEFMRTFFAPLKMWSKGDEYIARHSLYGEQIPMMSYWRYKSKIARFLPKKYLSQFEFVWYKYKALNTVSVVEFLRLASVSNKREKIGRRLVTFSKRWGLPLSSVDLDRLEHKISHIKPPNIPSAWADYHKDIQIDNRQNYIINVIKEYKPTTVLDMAGNAGFFSKVISALEGVQYVVCADYDTNAIDQLYESLKCSNQSVYPVVMNFSISVADSKFPSEYERFKSDMVLALALTHHLLLTQKLTIDFIMNRLTKLSKKYVAVEFMPLGLYSSRFDKIPDIPEWYTVDWFRAGFLKYFTLLEEKEIDTNRIIFIGKK
ncbi:MAG: hypothetical protein KDI35_00405 [Gammaproteobacteria bacterium]|nr:hypothetical protein [Gammaproteobacteria bacterium]